MNVQNSHAHHDYAIKNVYCASVEQTAVTCLVETDFLQQGQAIAIEVPFEQYEQVITIVQGKNAVVASSIHQGAFTYEQVLHIADACNIHNLRKNDEGRLYFLEEKIGMSAAIAFAQSKWNGANRETAIENAVYTGLTILGEPFAELIIREHFEEIKIEEHIHLNENIRSTIRQSSTKVVVKKMATKVTQKAMYSSILAKKAILLLNANVVTGALITGIMSSVDIARAIKGQMSPAQLFKNVAKTASSVAGGIAGNLIGGGVGINIPNVSTTVVSLIGGAIGLIIGSIFAKKLTTSVFSLFIKDDAVKMLEIFNIQLMHAAEQYLLNEEELMQVLQDFNMLYNMPEQLRQMHAAENREQFAKDLILPELNRIVRHRMYLHVPTNEEIYQVWQTI